MTTSIVFGTTLKPDNQPLTEVAALLAARMSAQLRLVHVSEDPRAPIVLGTDEEHVLGPVRGELEREAQRLRALTGADVHPHLAAGAVVSALVSVAEFELARALLVGGGSSAGRNLLGNTAERASRKSAVPVMTLRDTARLVAWLRGERPLRVLVGADLGRAAEAARSFAASLQAVGPCDIQVLLVASPREAHASLGLPPPEDEHALSSEAEAAILRELTRAAGRARRGVPRAPGARERRRAPGEPGGPGQFRPRRGRPAPSLHHRAALVRVRRARGAAGGAGQRRVRST